MNVDKEKEIPADGKYTGSIYPRGGEVLGEYKNEIAVAVGIPLVLGTLASCTTRDQDPAKATLDALNTAIPLVENAPTRLPEHMQEDYPTTLPSPIFTRTPEGTPETPEIVSQPTPSVSVAEAVGIERFDGTNGEPTINGRDEVTVQANDMLRERGYLGEEELNIDLKVNWGYDRNGDFRWLSWAELDNGNTIVVFHLDEEQDVAGASELSVSQMIEKGFIEDKEDLKFMPDFNLDTQVPISRLTIQNSDGEPVWALTDLRLDRTSGTWAGFPDRLLEDGRIPVIPEEFEDLDPYADAKNGNKLLLENVGDERPQTIEVEGEWQEIKDITNEENTLLEWDNNDWEYDTLAIPENIQESLPDGYEIEGVRENEDGSHTVYSPESDLITIRTDEENGGRIWEVVEEEIEQGVWINEEINYNDRSVNFKLVIEEEVVRNMLEDVGVVGARINENNPTAEEQIYKYNMGSFWLAWNVQNPNDQISFDEFIENMEDHPVYVKTKRTNETDEMELINPSDIKTIVNETTIGRDGETYETYRGGSVRYGWSWESEQGVFTFYQQPRYLGATEKYNTELKDENLRGYLLAIGTVSKLGSQAMMPLSAIAYENDKPVVFDMVAPMFQELEILRRSPILEVLENNEMAIQLGITESQREYKEYLELGHPNLSSAMSEWLATNGFMVAEITETEIN